MIKEIQLPPYVRMTTLFVGLIALAAILYVCKSILVPIVFALVIAIVLHPVVNFLVRMKINRIIAIIITMLLTVFILIGIGSFLLSQVSLFTETWPALVDKFTLMTQEGIAWVSSNFDINPQKINDWISKTTKEIVGLSTAAIGQTLVIFGSVVVVLFLIPVYVFLILFYHPILIEFINRIFGENDPVQVKGIITQSKTVIQRYLIGLVIEAAIVATLDAAALFALGIDYAILLAIIAAVLNVIPYIGGIIAVALPMVVAIATKDSAWYAVYVMIAYYIIQLIDNNIIVPYIVAAKVKINALFSILVVFIGNALWGIPGMFLSIPLLAIVKVFFDHIEKLKPWGFLLGDSMPSLLEIPPILKIIKKKEK
jgi:predicted PurR-regulated permease PerM